MYRLYSIKDFFRYDLPYGIRNLIAWFPLVWADRDWDWEYLAGIMEFKMRRMADNIARHGMYEGFEVDVQNLNKCADILKTLIEDEHPEPITRKSIRAHERDMRQQQRLLGKIIGERMRYWWD